MAVSFPKHSPEPNSKGIIYIVQDSKEYLEECIFSAKSVKKFHPDLPITLFTNLLINRPLSCFDKVVFSDTGLHPFKSKVFHIAASTYERTLFLDTDTQILGPIIQLFDLLGDSQMALAYEPYKSNFEQCKKAGDFANVKAFNTGVILFKYTPAIYAFFEKWYDAISVQPDEELNYFNSDQDYFNFLVMEQKQLDKLGVRVAILDNKVYNVRTWIIQSLKEMGVFHQVKLLHHRGLHLSPIRKIMNKMKDLFKRKF